MSRKLLLTLVCCVLTVAGCNIIYKQNIQQGNAIEQDKLDQLKLGMTMNQVAFLLGTPAIHDPFHQDRWDYYHSFAIRGGEPYTRLVTLKFGNAILTEMKGVDYDEQDAVVNADSEKTPEAVAEEIMVEAESREIEVDDEIPADNPAGEQVVEPAHELGAESVPDPVISTIETPVADSSPVIDQAIPAAEENPARWIIQIGAFDLITNAQNMAERMQQEGFQGFVIRQDVANLGTRYLVRTQGYESRAEAESELELINAKLEIDAFLVPPSN